MHIARGILYKYCALKLVLVGNNEYDTVTDESEPEMRRLYILEALNTKYGNAYTEEREVGRGWARGWLECTNWWVWFGPRLLSGYVHILYYQLVHKVTIVIHTHTSSIQYSCESYMLYNCVFLSTAIQQSVSQK